MLTCPCMSAVRCGRCRGEWSSNVKVLVVAIVLFTLMTMVQFVAAIVAHSGALLVDCASMLADAMSYMGNLYTECKGGKEDEAVLAHRALVSTGLSIVVLYGITIWGLSSATAVLLQRPVKDDLEATTVLIFGLIGVVVDAFTLLAFRVWGSDIKEPGFTSQGNSRVIFRMGSMGSGYSHTHTVSSLTRGESVYMNMCSALTHVLADAVRSMTAITLGVVVLTNRSLNGSVCDAYATLIVALTIILGNIPLLRRWSRAVNLFFSFGDKPVRTDTGCNPMHEHHTRRVRQDSICDEMENPRSPGQGTRPGRQDCICDEMEKPRSPGQGGDAALPRPVDLSPELSGRLRVPPGSP